MRILSIVLGIIMLITGIYCFINMGAAVASLAFVLGIVLTAYGISEIGSWFATRKNAGVSGWVLAEGILTALIGLIIIFYPLSELVIAVWFAIWLLMSGILRIIAAMQTKKYFPGSPWGWMFLMGILTSLVGFYGIINPVAAGIAIALLLGIFFMLQGINCLVLGFGSSVTKANN